ncbi:glyoxylate/hydroxypyruvate reductase A-like [Patiria miniata]|uniref:D-isomer specific 2-hydroxyacid dehydrogenase NAD-binding domain-containing protein n=1 Tax=Patiria miniata TaxID=46514 RepID=A0A914BII3_PATMI|nr:glyoxylate/hydroxypyruvate reductase A-like [Patiria miniata]
MASEVVLKSKLPVVTIFTRYASGGLLESWKKRLGNVPYNFLQVLDHQKAEETVAQLQEAEILLTDPDLIGSFFHQLPKTKWVQSTWAGIDSILKEVNPKDIPPPFMFTRLGVGLRTSMAEYVIGQMIAHERHFYEMKKCQEQKEWKRRNYRVLGHLTLGIIGLGDIGEEIARLCKAFGMRIWGLGRRDLRPEERSKNVDEYRPLSGLAELLADCDYICNVLPQTPATDDLLSGDVLSSCTKQPVFINVGRGNVISDDTVLNALDKGWISHAILDVFRTEPLPASSPLWSSPKVTVTAHTAANTHPGAIIDIMEVNYDRYINGKPLQYQVDWKLGY